MSSVRSAGGKLSDTRVSRSAFAALGICRPQAFPFSVGGLAHRPSPPRPRLLPSAAAAGKAFRSSREVSSRARFSCVSRAEHLVFRQLRRASVPGGSAGPAGLDPSPPSAEIGSAAVTRGLPFRRPRPALARPVIPFRCRFCCCFRPPAPAGFSVSSLSGPAGLFPVTRGRSPRLRPSRPRAPRTPQHVCATVGHFSR